MKIEGNSGICRSHLLAWQSRECDLTSFDKIIKQTLKPSCRCCVPEVTEIPADSKPSTDCPRLSRHLIETGKLIGIEEDSHVVWNF